LPSPDARLREAVILIAGPLPDPGLLLGIIDRGLDIRCVPRQANPFGGQILQFISLPRPCRYKSTEKTFSDVWRA
jgi:hypothetical protein